MALEDAKTQVDTAFTRKGLRGLAFENAFAGATSFLRRSYTKDLTGVDLAITGVPFDQAVTHRTGTRFGPRAIREASHMLCDGTHPLFDVSPADLLCDLGDLALPNTSLERMREAMAPQVAALLAQQRHMVWLGGDPS